MDPRIQQLIAADRLQRDILAARAARDAAAVPRRVWFRNRRTVVATRRFLRRSQTSIAADR
jgi:hypothetical protein